MKYNDVSFGQAEAVFNKLGGMEGVKKFLAGETIVVPAIKIENAESFPIWKTITLGQYKDADAYRKAFKKAGFKIGGWANDILGKPAFTIAPTEESIDLVILTVEELGFKNGATYKEICEAAVIQGLEKCPNEVGPALRLQYPDQPSGEWLRIAMEPITGSGGYLRIFGVGHDDGARWLSASYGHPGDRWRANRRFVFRLRK